MTKRIVVIVSLIFIIVEFAAFWQVENFHNNEIEQYLEKQTDLLAVKLNTAQKAFILVSKNIFEQNINQPQILKLYSKAIDADSAKQAIIRDSLYNMLLPTYNYLKLTHIKQLHFHLPNNHSFLRFHRPAKFGDDLSNIRYSVKMTNQTHQNYYGFEEGKFFNGFRNVFPLFYDNKYIGSVEISFSFDAIKLQLKQYENDIYGLMLKKEVVNEKLFKNEKSNYTQSPFSENYLYEKKYKHYSADSILNKQLETAVSNEITNNLANNNSFSIYKKLDRKYFVISFVSIKNIKGEPVANLFSYKEDKGIVKIKESSLRMHLASSLGIAVIILLIFFTPKRNVKIKEIDENYKNILDANNDIVFMVDITGKQLYFNNQVENLLGYKQVEVIGKSFTNFVPKQEIPKYLSKLKEIFIKKQISPFETLSLHKNGNLIPVEISGKIIKHDGKIVGVGTIRDIRRRKETEEKLHIRMQQQQTIIDNLPANIFLKDADLKFISVNRVYAKKLKIPIKELIGKRYTDFFPDEQFVEDTDKEILKTSKPKLDFIKQAGDKWLQISKVPYFDSKNKVLGIVGIIQDITKSRNEKQKILELNSDLKNQKQEQDILNQKLFAQSLEVDQQRIDIEDQNDLLNKQKEKIEYAHKNIIDSINYAKSIQNALLTRTELIDSYFSGEHFILFKPKETVSGDFYYVNKVENNLLFAVADCTGHGVPGGFITMLGITYLHGIIRRFETNNPGDALNILRKRIKEIFRTFGTENYNGLDIAFCSINLDTHILQYAGAYNPLWIIRNNEFIEIKATRNPIGFYPEEKPFKNNEIQLQNNDKIYIFTDGYKDQFGGKFSKTYTNKRFREFLISISDLPMQKQNDILETELKNWQGNNEQIDDITILGLEYKIDKFA